MCGLRVIVSAVIAAVAWPAGEATAIPRRKACRLSCGPAIDGCVAAGELTTTMQAVLFESDGVFPFYCDFHGVTQGMFGAVQVIP